MHICILSLQKGLRMQDSEIMAFIKKCDDLEKINLSNKLQIESLNKEIDKYMSLLDTTRDKLDVVMNAIAILRGIQDESVKASYKEIESRVNDVLSRVFTHSIRRIELVESTLRMKYPQLELRLIVEGGKIRSLKDDSGHGIMQIISLICLLSLIVITGGRRLVVLDEVLSGLSVDARKTVSDVLNQFTELGFQFVVNEHLFIPDNAYVYKLEVHNGVSEVVDNYLNTGFRLINESDEDI